MPVFEERQELERITLEPKTGTVFWRYANIVLRDGVEISRTYSGSSVEAGLDHPDLPTEVAQVRPLVDTPTNREKVQEKRRQVESILRRNDRGN